ncbi:MAG: hypothetical protein KatS3mg126_2479 [Lysobacteraceae bacterium]|nr:MAG: hypothetical protein KatS3mg126_2479 [Xanthomonadaceae bacterium]
MTPRPRPVEALFLVLATLFAVTPAAAAEGDRLLATGGASSIEGGGGGGIVPWAVVAGYGTESQWGGAAFLTRAQTRDFALEVQGLALGLGNRLELALAEQRLELPTLAGALALPVDRFRQRVISAKLRLAGDLVYTGMPQVSLIAQHKRHRDFLVPSLVGARDDEGIDWVLSASKLWLAGAAGYNLLGTLNLRSSRANQAGLLGFGGDGGDDRRLLFEGSLAVLPDRHWAVGLEYRQKPDRLRFAREDDWRDAFVAWFPNKRVAVVAAWADLGDIATLRDQRGWYLSLQVSQ